MRQIAKNLHWTARLVIKCGTIATLLLLLSGIFLPRYSETAYWLLRSAVYSFAVSIVGGLLLDVIAARMGMRNN